MEGFNWSIVGWIGALLFVYFFGIFEGRGQGRKRRIAEEQEEKKNQPPPQPETIKVDDPGILRIKNENGDLSLDLDGERADTTSLSSNQRKRLIEILNVIRPWLDGKPAVPMPPPQPTQSQSLLDRLDAVTASPQVTTQSIEGMQSKPAPVQSTSPVQSPVSTQNKSATSATSKKDNKPEAAPTSMVGQINAILQLRIANTPLATRGITMMDSPSGGVIVFVGVNKYEGVEDVPSEEVKTAIRAAIAEWERKYTPGLS